MSHTTYLIFKKVKYEQMYNSFFKKNEYLNTIFIIIYKNKINSF